MSMRLRSMVCAAALLLPGCRDGVQPFTPPTRSAEDIDPRQLTFGLGNERDAQWSPDGDSIYFHSDRWFDAPGPGTLLRIALDGGTASPLSDFAQPNPATFLSTPVASAKGDRLAFLHFARVAIPSDCSPGDYDQNYCPVPEPILDSAVLRVRGFSATNPGTTDPGLSIRYAGADTMKWLGGRPPFYMKSYPFQVQWVSEAESGALRPSWSPDGTRLAFSDGLKLYTWTPGQAAATPIAGTDDGVSVAWSPDGTWLAFTIIERGAAAQRDCMCSGNPPWHMYRTEWMVTAYKLAIVHPDGSGLRMLGTGRDPAWAPDSRRLYVRKGNAIYSLSIDSQFELTLVPGTQGGRSPAVSPDGKWLAFHRPKSSGDMDLWITRLGN